MSTDAAGFAHATDRSVAPPNGAFDAGLRPGPFPDRAASLLPGLLAATRTGLTPAGDDELPIRSQPLDDHLLIPGRTGWSTRATPARICVPPVRTPSALRLAHDPSPGGLPKQVMAGCRAGGRPLVLRLARRWLGKSVALIH